MQTATQSCFELPEWPAFGYADDVRPALARNRAAGQACVLATLAMVDGSGPRPVGSQMVFGRVETSGFLSGGCVEGALALQASAVLHTGAPEFVRYGRGSPYPDIQLVCGSGIGVLLERIGPDDEAAAALLEASEARRPVVWFTDGVRRACVAPEEAPPQAFAQAAELASGSQAAAGLSDGGVVWRRHDPAWRLIVIGADPTAMALASLGAQSGFESLLFRPKGPEEPPPLPGVAYVRSGDVAGAVAQLRPDRWTAVAVATHDADLDHEGTIAALGSGAGYVGALGARRRLPARLQRLRDAGIGESDIRRLRAPIGLPLGGKAPWEIAVSVIADIVRVRHGGSA